MGHKLLTLMTLSVLIIVCIGAHIEVKSSARTELRSLDGAEPEEAPTLKNNGKIFISYLTCEAGKLAGLLAQRLRALGKDVFYAQESLLSGCVYPDVLNREVLDRDIFIPLITPGYGLHNSNRSKWCLSELTIAYNENKKIKPITILDASAKYPPDHMALQLGIFQAIPWLPLKECQDSLGDKLTLRDKWPERCLDIVARILTQFD